MIVPKSQPHKAVLCIETIGDRVRHYEKLFEIAWEITQLPEDCLEVTIDFGYCEFLGHLGVAFLGHVAMDDNGVKYENSRINFSGTLVDIAFQCDEQYYCLASEAPLIDKPLF